MNRIPVLVGLITTIAMSENVIIPTRFGTLNSSDDNILLMNTTKLSPVVEGNSHLRAIALFQIGEKDVVILENIGGSACPSLLRIVAVSNDGVQITDEFGSCTDIYTISFAEEIIKISMSGFSGESESEKDSKQNARKKFTYTYNDGKLKEVIR